MQINGARYGYQNTISLANDNGANRIGAGSNGTAGIAKPSWNSEVVRRVDDVVRNRFGLDADFELKPDTVIWLDGPDSLGGDSLDMVELIMDLREEFDIRIADSEVPGMSSLADIYTVIQRKASLV